MKNAILTALLLVLLAALHARGSLPVVPSFGKLRVSFFQAMETAIRYVPMLGTDR